MNPELRDLAEAAQAGDVFAISQMLDYLDHHTPFNLRAAARDHRLANLAQVIEHASSQERARLERRYVHLREQEAPPEDELDRLVLKYARLLIAHCAILCARTRKEEAHARREQKRARRAVVGEPCLVETTRRLDALAEAVGRDVQLEARALGVRWRE